MTDLVGQVAFVSGASRGIGRALAVGLATAGAQVVATARTKGDLDALADELSASAGGASTIELDVTQPAMVTAAFETIVHTHGRLDIAVLNAGVFPAPAKVADASQAGWTETFAVNLFGVVSCARAAIPLLRQGNGGKIIVIGSGTGHQANPGLGAYAASKAAVASLVQTLAVELREDHIAVNELIPGPVVTNLNPGAGQSGTSLTGAETEWIKQPDEVVDLALLLARFPNHGPTGQTFSLMGRPL
jgi:3-oxoacyl-[acyl-carrier protein] reductase